MAVDEQGNEIINEPSDTEKRIKGLSDKVRVASEERDSERTLRETAEAKVAEAERKALFAEGFTDILTQNPAAKDHKEDIRAKVNAGYSLEDATYAVLGKAGKLGQAPIETPMSIAGGSATIGIPQGGKTTGQMTRDEKRLALKEAESRGDLSLN